MSITDQTTPTSAPGTTLPDEPSDPDDEPGPTTTTTTTEPVGPVLLGAGEIVGLAGHEGTGDAGLFLNPDGTYILRFENFDIENGPDLDVYLVPGADQVSLPRGASRSAISRATSATRTTNSPLAPNSVPAPTPRSSGVPRSTSSSWAPPWTSDGTVSGPRPASRSSGGSATTMLHAPSCVLGSLNPAG